MKAAAKSDWFEHVIHLASRPVARTCHRGIDRSGPLRPSKTLKVSVYNPDSERYGSEGGTDRFGLGMPAPTESDTWSDAEEVELFDDHDYVMMWIPRQR